MRRSSSKFFFHTLSQTANDLLSQWTPLILCLYHLLILLILHGLWVFVYVFYLPIIFVTHLCILPSIKRVFTYVCHILNDCLNMASLSKIPTH